MSPLLTYIHNNFNRQPRTMPVIICQSPSKTALIDTYEMPASIQLHLHPFKCLNSSSLLHLAVHGPKISNWNVNFYQDDEWFYPDTFPLLALNHISQQCSISHITVLLLSQIPLIDMVADSREKKKKKHLLWLLNALVMKTMIIAFHTECFCQDVRHLWW